MHLSLFSNAIQGETPEAVARKTREYGLESVQFTPPEVEVGFGFDPDAGAQRGRIGGRRRR